MFARMVILARRRRLFKQRLFRKQPFEIEINSYKTENMAKKMLGSKSNEFVENVWLLILRASAGGFMLTHGIPKLLKLVHGDTAFADPFGIGALPSFVLVIFAEVICSVLVILGIGTRLAAIPLIITMGVAAFMIHRADPFASKELALLFLLAFTTVLVYGSGKYALGGLISGK